MNTHQQELSFLRQLRVVLMSYVTRPGFRWALVSLLSGISLPFIAAGIHRAIIPAAMRIGSLTYTPNPDSAMSTFANVLEDVGALVIPGSAIAMLILFFWHARQQLMGTTARLIPLSRTPNLIVAGTLFFVMPLLIASLSIGDPRVHFFGIFIVAMLFMTMTGWAVCNPWLAPIPIVLALLAARNNYAYGYMIEITRVVDHTGHPAPNRWIEQLWKAYDAQRLFLRILVTLADVLALAVLEKLARPRKRSLRLSSFLPSRSAGSLPVFNKARHQLVASVFARSLHRRFAVHDWRAASVAALGVAGLSVWLNVDFKHDAPAVISILIALLPGALVAVGWRDRWEVLDFESLYPVSRRQFVTDMAAGLVLDAAEFWIASIAAAIVACLCTRSSALTDARFWMSIVLSGMLQFLWIGGVFFIGQRRQTWTYIAGLAPLASAIFLTIELMWREARAMPLMTGAIIATAEAGAGIALLLATWKFLQRGSRSETLTLAGVNPAV